MKRLPAALLFLLFACGKDGASNSQSWLGDACEVPHLEFSIDDQKKVLALGEYQISGTVRGVDGEPTSAVPSERQSLVQSALPCLTREAESRGFRLEYPVANVDF